MATPRTGTSEYELTDRDRDLLVRMADRTLGDRRRRASERRLDEIPGGRRLVEQQRFVAATLRAGPSAPPHLRAAARPAPARAGRRPRWGLRLAPAAVVATCAAILIALVGIGQPGRTPTAVQAAELGMRPVDGSPPATRPGRPALLAAVVDGVAFPAWRRELGWRTVGARADRLDGRSTRTVFYEHDGHRVAYTIVGGAALEAPGDAALRRVNGVEMALFRRGHRRAVAFVRNGHTCVLSGHVENESTLVKLASWRGGGDVRFE